MANPWAFLMLYCLTTRDLDERFATLCKTNGYGTTTTTTESNSDIAVAVGEAVETFEPSNNFDHTTNDVVSSNDDASLVNVFSMFNSTELDEFLNSIIDISANTTTIDVAELSDGFYASNSSDIYDAQNTDTFTLFSTKVADISTSTATSTPADAVTSENVHVPQVMAEYDTSTYTVDDVPQCRAIAVSANDILYDDFEYG